MKMRQRKARFNRNYPVKTFRCGTDLAVFLKEMDNVQDFLIRTFRAYAEIRR